MNERPGFEVMCDWLTSVMSFVKLNSSAGPQSVLCTLNMKIYSRRAVRKFWSALLAPSPSRGVNSRIYVRDIEYPSEISGWAVPFRIVVASDIQLDRYEVGLS